MADQKYILSHSGITIDEAITRIINLQNELNELKTELEQQIDNKVSNNNTQLKAELEQQIDNKVSKDGDIITGTLEIEKNENRDNYFSITDEDETVGLDNYYGALLGVSSNNVDNFKATYLHIAGPDDIQDEYLPNCLTMGIIQDDTNFDIPVANSINAPTLSNFYNINENDDLNNYLAVGNYAINSTVSAKTLTNTPVNEAFTMIVYNSTGSNNFTPPTSASYNYRNQIVFPYNDASIYRRTIHWNNSTVPTFGEWKKLPFGGPEIDLLWTNPSPDDSFESQEITVQDLSYYNFLLIADIWSYNSSDNYWWYTGNKLFPCYIKEADDYYEGFYIEEAGSGYRRFDIIDATTIHIHSGYDLDWNKDNSRIVPCTIYGIKLN